MRLPLLTAALMVTATIAQAQVDHTWVSTTGVDKNNTTCTVKFPCATLQRAHDELTGTFGTITVLAPGEYGPMVITKEVAVDNDTGGPALLIPSGGPCITIDATKGGQVYLRGLTCDGLYANPVGIQVVSAQAVTIERSSIKNFGLTVPGGVGVLVTNTDATQLFISDTTIYNNGSTANTGGVFITPAAPSAKVLVVIEGSRVIDNVIGVLTTGPAVTTLVRNSSFAGNFGAALNLQGSSAMVVDHTSVFDNVVGVQGQAGTKVFTTNTSLVIGNRDANVTGGFSTIPVTAF